MKVTAEFDTEDLPFLIELLRRSRQFPAGLPGGGTYKFDYERTEDILNRVVGRLEGTIAPEPRPIDREEMPERFGGHYWCPACEEQLVDPGPSDDVWHHLHGERGRCTWTD